MIAVMKIMFSIIMHKDGTPVTTKEWFDMEENFDRKMLQKYLNRNGR